MMKFWANIAKNLKIPWEHYQKIQKMTLKKPFYLQVLIKSSVIMKFLKNVKKAIKIRLMLWNF